MLDIMYLLNNSDMASLALIVHTTMIAITGNLTRVNPRTLNVR